MKSLTFSSICGVWAADKQNLERDSIIGVVGKPTTTTAMPRANISRLNALTNKKKTFHYQFLNI